MHVVVTSLQLVVGQAGVFTTEHQRNLLALPGAFHCFAAAFAGVEHRPGQAATAGTGTDHQGAAHQGLFEGGDHLRACQHIISAGGTGTGLGGREIRRVDQHQARQAHVLHGTRSAADIAGVAGADQNDTNIFQHVRRSQTRKEGSKSYRTDRRNAT